MQIAHAGFRPPGSSALEQSLLQGLTRRCCIPWHATDQDRAFPKSTMGFEWNPEGQSQQRLTGMHGWARWGARFSWTDSAGWGPMASSDFGWIHRPAAHPLSSSVQRGPGPYSAPQTWGQVVCPGLEQGRTLGKNAKMAFWVGEGPYPQGPKDFCVQRGRAGFTAQARPVTRSHH